MSNVFSLEENQSGDWKIKWKTRDQPLWWHILEQVRTLQGRRYFPDSRIWTCPKTKKNYNILKELGFIKEEVEEAREPESIEPIDDSWKDISIDPLAYPGLRPYQMDFLRFCIHRNGKMLLGDEMGTGKTVQALSWLKMKSEYLPALMVVPARTKIQWKREYMKWSGRRKVQVLEGQTPHPLDRNRDYIINWDILFFWYDELKQINLKCIIADECHFMGNRTSKRTKKLTKLMLCDSVESLLFLSGTPIRNRPEQFWPLLSMLDRRKFSDYLGYVQRYCNPKHTPWGVKYSGASNMDELHRRTRPYILRRLKSEVIKDLPKHTRVVVPIDPGMEGRALYLEKKKGINLTGSSFQARAALEKLKNDAYLIKRLGVLAWIQDFLDSGNKLVIFAYHTAVIVDIMEKFKSVAVRFDGKSTVKEKENAKKNFINDEKIKIMVAQIQAAGVGVDGLQAVCSDSVFIELCWSPTDHSQAEARLHRINQKNPVNSYYLIMEDTIEDDLMKSLDAKMKNINKVIDGKDTMEEDLFSGLLEKYKSEKY